MSTFHENYTREEYIQKMDSFIETQISEFKINSIGNLVLLYASLNRSISNNTYSIKRARIIQYFNKGHFIQPHTFQVFVRYFNNTENENRDLEHWTKNDIEANALRISLEIKKFLTPKTT
ncbi:hypothetical protein C7S20_18315 [Christiangramia fulva]|uniref:GmrSD restriction endonucleases C-terminal domain-containing protein n=1 Tax=Christiangramia fulva TaxID=2126553 RepID=A0A2R3Z9R9_9FLAO|nr:DUF1524 domain-containing protein [Christiangramia fulva]AVR47043.1 hypothetical protein C7S20_18315 [Christiangramia fulva]